MNHGSLFSGIGGFDLAAEWMGWDNKFHCDINPFSRKVCKHYWPNAESYDNIKTTDFTIWRGHIDVLSGGFPCQPFSTAGRRLGTEDERHLWPEMCRAIREIRPRYVVGENVRGLLSWSGGLVLDEVYADLESEGYEVQTFVLPAISVNAPHKRDRVWIVASDTMQFGLDQRKDKGEMGGTQTEVRKERSNSSDAAETNGKVRNTTNTNHSGLEGYAGQRVQGDERRGVGVQDVISSRLGEQTDWDAFPTQPPVCGGDDGLPSELDGITFPRWRKESVMAYGNAIVPNVAYAIFKTIYETELIHAHR